jgi:ligand-binding SRPBCC domain-containing protein
MNDRIDSRIFNPVVQKRLAKYLVQQCFRNSTLEDLHAGVTPSSPAGDYSDVVVRTPLGQIPWRELSRFGDTEMKLLMIDVVQRTYEFLRQLFDTEVGGELVRLLAERDLLPGWENPK